MNIKNTLLKIVFCFLVWNATILFSHAQQQIQQKFDCFSIVVGKDASVDGSVIVGHNEDTGTALVNFYKVPEGNSPAGETVNIRNGGKIVRSAENLGYLWLNRPESDVCDSYLNEKGIVVASDGCPSREDNPDLDDGGIVFWLRRSVAEQAHSARQGVKIAGKLIDRFGYDSSGRTYVIADSQEGWLLAVVNGKHWIAQRVPDDQVAIIANCYTMGEIDLTDTLNFLRSPDIVDYAVQRGWYDPVRDGDFHFTKAYSNPGSITHPGNVNRMWSAINILSGRQYSLKDKFPSMFRPEEKISIHDVMTTLRVHYDEKVLAESEICTPESPEDLKNASICGKNTQYSLVALLRSGLPSEIGSMMWIAPFRPDVHSYSPWYPSVIKVPDIFGFQDYNSALKHQFDIAPKTYDRNNGHAFWTYVSLADKADEDYGRNAPHIKNEWKHMEKEMFSDHEEFEKDIIEVLEKNPEKALKKITKFSSKTIIDQYKLLKKLSDL